MVARPGKLQGSFNAGEQAPELHGRTELKTFFSGAARMLNVEPVPQGGFRLAPRTRDVGAVRGGLTPGASGAVAATLGAAGTVGTLDMGADVAIAGVDLLGLTSAQTLAGLLSVEALNVSTGLWQALAPPFSASATARARRAALAPGVTVTARFVRLRLVGAPPAATAIAATLAAFVETPGVQPVRLVPFTSASGVAYQAVLTPGAVDFWREGAFVGCCAITYAGADVPAIKTEQRADSMIVYHQNYPQLRVLRVDADHEWAVTAVPYTDVPQVDYGGVYVNVPDAFDVYIRYGATTSPEAITLVISVNGLDAPGVQVPAGPDWVAFGVAIKASLESMASVETGLTVSVAVAGLLAVVSIAFTGTGNTGATFALSARIPSTPDANANVVKSVNGSTGGENLFGTVRGYPSVGVFYQDRLFEGGFRSKVSAFLASVTADYFNLNIAIPTADGAILYNLDTDGAERIIHMERARHLCLFTTDAEYYLADRAVSKTAVPNIVQSSRNGSSELVPVVENEGSLIYVARNRGTIYAATYSDVSQAYDSQPLSLLASHLCNGLIGAALQRATDDGDAARLWLVRDDGTVVIGVLIRNQDVTGFVRWETAGAVRAVMVDGRNDPYLAVERTIAGAQRLRFERLEPDLILDGTVTSTGAPRTLVTGLAAHEGAVVHAEADGYTLGPFTVAGGAITLPVAAATISVGRWTAPELVTLPLPREVADRTVLRRPARVHTVRLHGLGVTSLAVGANGQPLRAVPLYRAGDPVDQPQRAVTGEIVVTGIRGYSPDAQVTIGQIMPGRLAIRDVIVEART